MQSNPLKQLQLRGHDNEITAFAMSPSGAFLATGQKGQNSDVIIWNTQTLMQQSRFQVCQPAHILEFQADMATS
jgi:WD40 repeat protein